MKYQFQSPGGTHKRYSESYMQEINEIIWVTHTYDTLKEAEQDRKLIKTACEKVSPDDEKMRPTAIITITN